MKDIIYTRSAYIELLNKALEGLHERSKEREIEIENFKNDDAYFEIQLRKDIFGMYNDWKNMYDVDQIRSCGIYFHSRMMNYYYSDYLVDIDNIEYVSKLHFGVTASSFLNIFPVIKTTKVETKIVKEHVEYKIPYRLLGFIPWYKFEVRMEEKTIENETVDWESRSEYWERVIETLSEKPGYARLEEFCYKYRRGHYNINRSYMFKNKYLELIESLNKVIEKVDNIPDAMFSIDASTYDRYNSYIVS